MSISLSRLRSPSATKLAAAMLLSATAALTTFAGTDPPPPLPTTPEDFFQPGTQPDPGFHSSTASIDAIVSATQCKICHGEYDVITAPHDNWINSMMGQAARDPLFYAGLAIAGQDVAGAAEYCVRCHVPVAWLGGNANPKTGPDGPIFDFVELEGVNCDFCHRLVDPVFKPKISPAEDEFILADLGSGNLPPEGSNSRYIIDPTESRRGPFDDIPFNAHFNGDIVYSPFHQSAELCWTCHDVSNPLVSRQTDGTYLLNELGASHATASQNDMFPLHRTYSEWSNSYYKTAGGIQHNGRFGGNHINNPDFIADGTAGVMHTCQDCHLPDEAGTGCGIKGFPERQDVPQHSFLGSNTWVQKAVFALHGKSSGMTAESAEAGAARNASMLQLASDLLLSQEEDDLKVRIVNQTGHKIPTGFPDGRRMWINVKFLDAKDQVVLERGAYDFDTAELSADDTKVYETTLGIDETQSALVGRPAGPTFHFLLANQILKDNRIPPQGYSETVALTTQTAPVGATYVNGQHWDDTAYVIPLGATKAVVTVYYQVTSKEFIEFLRDENITDNTGQTAYDQWVLHGRSAPVAMATGMLTLTPVGNPFDLTGDGEVGPADLAQLLAQWGKCPACPADYDLNGDVGPADLAALLAHWGV